MVDRKLPQWTVSAADEGTRLDKFLAAADRLGSRSRVTAALERAKVFVNDAEVGPPDAASRLGAGDVVSVWMDRPGSSRRRPGPFTAGDLEILYEDADLVVVNKPVGVLSVPLHGEGDSSAYGQVQHHLRSSGRRRPSVVHRIDRDTSGLVVFAKHARAQEHLKAQFRRREPERVYLAVVYGRPDPSTGTWRDTLVWDQHALIQKQTHPSDPKGAEAICHYRVVETFPMASLIEVRLETGKRNQIRIQARLRGHTLIGERRYVFGPDELRPIDFPRQALHAHRLAFRHPANGRMLQLEAPLPEDMTALLSKLRSLG